MEEEEEEEEPGEPTNEVDPYGTGCVLCKKHDFQRGGFGERTILICDQCEREFHVGCLKEHHGCDLQVGAGGTLLLLVCGGLGRLGRVLLVGSCTTLPGSGW